MKIFKKLLPIIFTLTVIVVMLVITSTSASAASSGKCGDNLTWRIESNVLKITGTGEMYDYYLGATSYGEYKSSAPWIDAHDVYNNNIIITHTYTSIQIGNGVTSIGDYAFYNNYFKSISLPDSLKKVGEGAFDESSYYDTESNWSNGILYIGKVLGAADPSISGTRTVKDGTVIIAEKAFIDCNSLTNVTIPDSVKYINDWAFGSCENLNTVSMGSSVKEIGYCSFYSCPSLTRVTIPGSVESIGESAFKYCYKLAYLNLNEGIKSIGNHAFASCRSLTRVNIPGSVVTLGEYAFAYCNGLKNVSIGEDYTPEETPSGTIGNYAFYQCTALLNAVIGDSVTTVGDAAFAECTSLQNVTFGNYISKLGKDAFRLSQKLTNVYLNNVAAWCNVKFDFYYNSSNGGYYSYASTPLYYAKNLYVNSEPATHLVIPDTVTNIGTYVFYNCQNVESITIPASVKSIEEKAFYYCNKLKTVYIEDIDAWCEIDFEDEYAIPFRYATQPLLYSNNELIVDLVIGDTAESIGKYAFYNCETIKTVTISDSVKSIGANAFYAINSLNKVDIGDSVTDIGEKAFYSCTAIDQITFGNSVENIGVNAFSKCTSLKNVTISDSVITVGTGAFNGCTSLTDVTLGKSVEVLDSKAFYGCTSLESIFIPRSVQVIYSDTFLNTNTEFVIKCYKNSQAHYFAMDYGYKYEILHEPKFTNYVDDNNATCTEDGTKTAYCDDGCGATDTVVIKGSAGHRYDADCDADCNVCGDVRTVSHKVKGTLYDLTNASNYPFTLSDGVYSSTNKYNNSSATVTLTALYDGSITIDYYTSTESGYDKLIIKHNSTTKVTASGQTSWKSVTVNVLNGDKIYITYSKDSSQSSGYDKVYFKLSANEVLTDASGVEATCLDGVVCGFCGTTLKNALGHSFTNYVSDGNATCENDGTKTAKCDRCDAADTLPDEGSKIPHRYNNYVYNGDATCTEDGTRTSPCDYGCGRTKTKVAEKTALGHDYEKTVTKAALCTKTGEAFCVCTRCADSYTESVSALGHSFTNYVSDNNATCTEDGTKTAKCDRCDASDTQTDTGSAFGHSYDNVCDAECNVCADIRNAEPHYVKKNIYNFKNSLTYPFILKDGVYSSTNTSNNSSAVVTLTALNDGSITIDYYTSTELNYDKFNIVHNSTTEVTASGETSWCSVTISVTKGDTIYIFYTKDSSSSSGYDKVYFKLSPAEVTYNADDEEATCLNGVVCTVCGTTVKNALGHSFTDYVSDGNATCDADGTETAKCDRCNVTDTQNDEGSALGHSFTNYISDGNATCDADGTKTAKCDRCNITDTQNDEGSALGHSFTDYVSDGNAACDADGTETAKCDRCNITDTQNDEGSALGHSFTDYVSDGNATCDADGTKTAKCNRCDVTDIVTDAAYGHSWNEWYTVTEATYVTAGTEEKKCSVCGAAEQREIPVLEFINPFTDIKESHWFYSSVEFVVKHGYMNGMSETTFSPNSNITREQFVLILANIAGVDTNEFKNDPSGFEDVKTGQWYSGAVTWAVREGYVSGMSATKFGRGQSIQRAALARMLYNYASENGINVDGRADLSAFGDAKEFDKSGNSWMVEPIQWAVHNGIISGMTVNGVNCVNPKGTATRAQAARMLMQFDALIPD